MATLHPNNEAQLAGMDPAVQALTREVWLNSVDIETAKSKLGVVQHTRTKLPVIITQRDIRAGEVMFKQLLTSTEALVPVIPELGGDNSLHVPMLVAMSVQNRDASPLWASVHCNGSAPPQSRSATMRGIPESEGSMRLLGDEDVAQVSRLFRCLTGARGWASYAPILAGVEGGAKATIVRSTSGDDTIKAALEAQETVGRIRMRMNLVLTPFAAAVPRTVDVEGFETGQIEAKRAAGWLQAYDAFKAGGGAPPPAVPGAKPGAKPSPVALEMYERIAKRLASPPETPLPNTYIDVLYMTEVDRERMEPKDSVSVMVQMVARRAIPAGTPLVRAPHFMESQHAADGDVNGHTRTVDTVLKAAERANVLCVEHHARRTPEDPVDAQRWMGVLSAMITTELHSPPYLGGLPPSNKGLFKDVTGTPEVTVPLIPRHIPGGDTLTPERQLALAQGGVVSRTVGSVVTYLVALATWLHKECSVTEAEWAARHSLWRSLGLMAHLKKSIVDTPVDTRNDAAVRAAQAIRDDFSKRVAKMAKGVEPSATPDEVEAGFKASADVRAWELCPTVADAKDAQFCRAAMALLTACGLDRLDLGSHSQTHKPCWAATAADWRKLPRGELSDAAKARIMELARDVAATH